jgi:hypothetical protein
MFKSKLSTTYPAADPGKHLLGDWQGIDPVLAGRLACHAESNKAVYTITSGYRSYEEQVKLYADYKAGKLQATAAVPGTSWHGSRLAVDTSAYPIRGATSAQLAMYGLCKPLKNEPWHIQPIETAKMGAKCNLSLALEKAVAKTEAPTPTMRKLLKAYEAGLKDESKRGRYFELQNRMLDDGVEVEDIEAAMEAWHVKNGG